MKFRLQIVSEFTIIVAQFMALSGLAAQAQEAQIVTPSRQTGGDWVQPPIGLQLPALFCPHLLPSRFRSEPVNR